MLLISKAVCGYKTVKW